MDIYKARNLQKFLFKRDRRNSEKSFKRMRTYTFGNEFYYTIFHYVSTTRAFQFTENMVHIILEDINNDVKVNIEYINKEINLNVPEGLYLIEFIEVD